jgi:hypothetical protein
MVAIGSLKWVVERILSACCRTHDFYLDCQELSLPGTQLMTYRTNQRASKSVEIVWVSAGFSTVSYKVVIHISKQNLYIWKYCFNFLGFQEITDLLRLSLYDASPLIETEHEKCLF